MRPIKSFAAILFLSCSALSVAHAQKFQINQFSFESQKEFIEQGYRCGTATPPDVQRTQDRARLGVFRKINGAFLLEATVTQIPVNFHVIQNDDGSGDVSDDVLDNQIKVLNDAYAKDMIHFVKANVDRTKNTKWYTMGKGSVAEVEAKGALGKNPETQLNLYTAGIQGGLLGWATFPFDLAANPKMDGVVILNTSVPGGAANPYNLGKTAVHECGHWLGLYHTFQGGCQPPGDEVDDTPPEATPATGSCDSNKGRSTCGGIDDFSNYMDYVDDNCMDHFTDGQKQRMQLQIATYRSQLLPVNTRSMIKALPSQ
jgi:hypothetical protein